MLRSPGWAGNLERRKQADFRAPPSATPPPPTGDPDFQPRHIERRTRMPLRPASPAEALRAQLQALASLPERPTGCRHAPANPERPWAGNESAARIPGTTSRTPTEASGGPPRRAVSLQTGPGLGPGLSIRTLRVRPSGSRRPPCPRSVPSGCRADARAAARATMTDYGEEQRNELEALESIYPDSFTGDFGGWGGGPGRAALPPTPLPGLSIQFPAPCPLPSALS